MHSLTPMALSVKELTAPHDELGVALVTLTAKVARELIDQNGHHLKANRPMSGATIEAYRRDMIGWRWRGDNGEALKFNKAGELIDGEHRLRALARISDDEYSLNLIVFFGVDDTARDTMDDGRKRSAADKFNLSHGAGKLGTKLSSALRALAIMGSGQGSGGRMSGTALIQLNEQHPHLLECVKEVMDVDKEDQVPVRPSIIAALYYAAKYLLGEPDKANDMLSVMRSGDKAYDHDPMHAWREYVIKNNAGVKKLAEAELMRGTLKAWNLFVKGEPLNGRFSIPKEQPLVDGLGVAKVFGDMVEGYLVTQPKAPVAPPTAAPKPKATNNKGPKSEKGSAAKAKPAAEPEAPTKEPVAGNGTPSVNPETGVADGLLNADGSVNLDAISDELVNDAKEAVSASDEAAKLAAKVTGKRKSEKGGTASPNAVH